MLMIRRRVSYVGFGRLWRVIEMAGKYRWIIDKYFVAGVIIVLGIIITAAILTASPERGIGVILRPEFVGGCVFGICVGVCSTIVLGD